MNHKATYIDTIHYRISDKAAGALAKATANGKLPDHGYEIRITVPDIGEAWMNRTRISLAGPKRGWVWCVYAIDTRHRLGNEFTFFA